MPRVTHKNSVGREILNSLTEFKTALEKGDEIAERYTVRTITLDLEATEYLPQDIRATRELLDASQAIFAKFLGVSVQTIRAWEQGDKSPRDVACRFMDEIRRDPEYWRKRLRSVAKFKTPSASN
jgi:putative transcriptional regulator